MTRRDIGRKYIHAKKTFKFGVTRESPEENAYKRDETVNLATSTVLSMEEQPPVNGPVTFGYIIH